MYVHTHAHEIFMILKLFDKNSEIKKMATSIGVVKITDEAHFQVIFLLNEID